MTWLDNSRILAAYAVVFLHTSAGIVLGNSVGSEEWWIGNIYDSAVRWCVPVFVMISGALLLDPPKQESLTVFYRKRLARILLPIIIWSLFFLAWTVLKDALHGKTIHEADLIHRLLSGKPYFHMWFLFMIMGLYLFTPFLRKIVAHCSRHELAVFIAATFTISALSDAYGVYSSSKPTLFINWFLSFIPFFFIGYWIRQDHRNPSKTLLWGIFLISVILTFTGCYLLSTATSLKNGLYFYEYLSLTVIPMSISLMYILKSWNEPVVSVSFTRKLSHLTLGVYLVHPVFLEIINYFGYGADHYHTVIGIPVVASMTFFISMAVAWFIHCLPYLRRII